MRLMFWRRPLTRSEQSRRDAIAAIKGIRKFNHRYRPIRVNEVRNEPSSYGDGGGLYI